MVWPVKSFFSFRKCFQAADNSSQCDMIVMEMTTTATTLTGSELQHEQGQRERTQPTMAGMKLDCECLAMVKEVEINQNNNRHLLKRKNSNNCNFLFSRKGCCCWNELKETGRRAAEEEWRITQLYDSVLLCFRTIPFEMAILAVLLLILLIDMSIKRKTYVCTCACRHYLHMYTGHRDGML